VSDRLDLPYGFDKDCEDIQFGLFKGEGAASHDDDEHESRAPHMYDIALVEHLVPFGWSFD
jgi:hypothetical protein